jgi:alpha-N-arabinofuranosidase
MKLFLVVLSFNTLLLNAGGNQKDKTNLIVISDDFGKDSIKKFKYGHFAEHLGYGIYGGIYVGENSSIPNTQVIRNDIVAALKEIGLTVSFGLGRVC